MTIILGCAETLAPWVPRGEADLVLAELQRAAGRASQLTRHLLVGGPPAADDRPLANLNDVVTNGVETLSRAGSCCDAIKVQLQLSTKPVLVTAEFDALERILLNLTLNARDAMDGVGVLTIETAVIGRQARLTVTDTGPGLTPEVQARMFEPFFTTKPEGTGLGLSSVASAVRRLRGSMWVQRNPGRGTSVSVILPLARPRV